MSSFAVTELGTSEAPSWSMEAVLIGFKKGFGACLRLSLLSLE